MPYLIGNAVTLSTTITDSSNTAVDPTTLSLVVTKPDGTTDSFTISQLTHGGTGQYSYVYLPATVGLYRYVWTSTSPAAASDGTFSVDSASTMVMDVAEAKTHLSDTETAHDDVLKQLVSAAQGVIEGLVGPLTPKSYTETYNGGGYAIILRHTPVIAIQSLTENWGTITYTLTNQPVGQATDAYGYDIDDPQAGMIVRRTVGSFPFSFFPGIGNITVTYTAGRTDLPFDIKLALIRQLRLLWADYQSGRTMGKGRQQQGPMPLVDPYVADLLRPYMLMPGIA